MRKRTSTAGIKQQRQEILKRGLVGIACVLALAFAVSFIGGGKDSPNPPQKTSSSEEISLDTDALLNDQSDAQGSQNSQQIPASRRFDYQGGGDAAAPIAPVATDTTQSTVFSKNDIPADAFMEEGLEPNQNETPTEATNTQPTVAPNPVTPVQPSLPQATESQLSSHKASLYCGNYSSSAKAEEQKALMAFQGLSSTVVRHQGSYALKLGPYKNRDTAKSAFANLDAKGLVTECTLENE